MRLRFALILTVVSCTGEVGETSQDGGGQRDAPIAKTFDAPPGQHSPDAPAGIHNPDAPVGTHNPDAPIVVHNPDASIVHNPDAAPPPPQPDAPAPPPPTSTANIYFPAGAPWTQDITDASPDSESETVIDDLANNGGWGNGNVFQIDFAITVLRDDGTAPMRSFTKWTQFFFNPDCDTAKVPVPTWGAIEGEDGLACTSGDDCHLIVAEASSLYEMWKADIGATTFRGGCLAIWDRTRIYPASGRGDGCSSADAAGYPIAALLFNADEVASGHIDHAIRFILPNSRMRPSFYVHPATHTTDVTGNADSIPYGARLRLRPDYPIANLEPGARVVAQAMQKYGMFLADGGEIALTAENDRFTTAKWDGLLGSHDLSALGVRDFTMVDGGERVPYPDCMRTPITKR